MCLLNKPNRQEAFFMVQNVHEEVYLRPWSVGGSCSWASQNTSVRWPCSHHWSSLLGASHNLCSSIVDMEVMAESTYLWWRLHCSLCHNMVNVLCAIVLSHLLFEVNGMYFAGSGSTTCSYSMLKTYSTTHTIINRESNREDTCVFICSPFM